MLPTTMITIHAAVCFSAIDDDDDGAKCELRKEIHLLPFVEKRKGNLIPSRARSRSILATQDAGMF